MVAKWAGSWGRRNPEGLRAIKRRWAKANPEAEYAKAHRYRARKLAGGSFTAAEWRARLAEYDGKCAYCGSTERIEIDHKTPVSRGGLNTIENIVPACRACNRRKSSKTAEEFASVIDRRPH